MEIGAFEYEKAMRLNRMAVFVWNLDDDTLAYNQEMEAIFPYTLPKEKISEYLLHSRIIHIHDRAHFTELVRGLQKNWQPRSAGQTQSFQLDFRVYAGKRRYRWLHLAGIVEWNSGRQREVTGFIQNVDMDRHKLSALTSKLEKDAMTGLYSKTYTPQLVDKILQRGGRHALLVLDLDHFKQVNDHLGHHVGDAVILDMALNLRKVFRRTDILGHIGGDEFAILLRDVSRLQDVYGKCAELRNCLRREYVHDRIEINVSASIGVALYPEHGSDYQTLFRCADSALYAAKRAGRDREVICEHDTTNLPPAPDHLHKADKTQTAADTTFYRLLENPTQYMLNLVMQSSDTALTVQIMLEIFAKRFHVDRAYVLWDIDGMHWPRPIFDYASAECKPLMSAHDVPMRRQMYKRLRQTAYGMVSECRDTSVLPQSACSVFARRRIRAYIAVRVMDGGRFSGSVGFDVCDMAHEWTDSEREVLHCFAEIMRRFLFGQIYYERMKKHGGLDF